MPPANWYVGSPSGRDRNHNNFLRLIVPPTSSPIAPAPKCTHQTSHLVKLWKLWIPHSKPLLSPRLTSKRYILLPRKLCHSVRSAEQKRRFFLLRVFLGSCARTSIFSKFTLRKSKKRKAPQTNLTILRCVPHPPRTSGPRQLPCRLRGRRRRGHQGLRDGINLRWSEFIQAILFWCYTPVFVFVSVFLILLFAFKVSRSRDTTHCFHLADPGWFTIQSICAILKLKILSRVWTLTPLLRPKQPPSWRWRCRRWRTPPSPLPCQPSCSRSVLSFIHVVVCKCGELSMTRHLIISRNWWQRSGVSGTRCEPQFPPRQWIASACSHPAGSLPFSDNPSSISSDTSTIIITTNFT